MPTLYHFLLALFCWTLFLSPALGAGSGPADKNNVADADLPAKINSVEERRILLSLREERRKLNREKEIIAERKNELKRLEGEVDKKLDELKKMRQELKTLLAEKDAAEQQRIEELAKIYQKMAPDKAAGVLVNLDEELAVAILNKMKIKSAAQILGRMGQDKAVKLTTSFSSLEP